MDMTGTSDSYVKWNEVMVFDRVSSKIRDIEILVTVVDYNQYLPNKTIGHMFIGLRSMGSGLTHWTAMLSFSRKPIAMWHRIIKESSWYRCKVTFNHKIDYIVHLMNIVHSHHGWNECVGWTDSAAPSLRWTDGNASWVMDGLAMLVWR